MKKLLYKIPLFVVANLILLIVLLYCFSYPVEKYDYSNSTTESNLLHMPKDQHFDLLILGTSHARVLSRFGNHQRMEKILDKSIINLSQGLGGGGILNQSAFARYFFSSGNTIDTILYLVDPFIFYNKYFDDNDVNFNREPFRLKFMWIIATLGFDAGVQYSYLYSKFTSEWLKIKPFSFQRDDRMIKGINAVSVVKRFNVVYPENLNRDVLHKKKLEFLQLIGYLEKQHSVLIFVIPPSIIQWPGYEELVALLNELQQTHGIPYYDFSNEALDKKYFADHDHLNTEGVVYFTRHYLSDIF